MVSPRRSEQCHRCRCSGGGDGFRHLEAILSGKIRSADSEAHMVLQLREHERIARPLRRPSFTAFHLRLGAPPPPPGWREPLKFRTLPGNRFARSLQTSLCGGARADPRGGRKTSQISEKPQELSHQSEVLLTSQWSHLSLKLDWRRTTFQVLHFRTRENNVERQKTPRHMREC